MTAAPVPERRLRARKGLAIYLAIVAVVSAMIEGMILRTGKPIGEQPLLVLALMWTPAVAALVARIALREGPRDVSFRLGGRAGAKMLLVAWIYPLAVGLIAYGLAWATGLERFAAPHDHASPALQLSRSIAVSATLLSLISVLTAAGEELGWRGYMLTRLIDAEVKRPILVSGVIWALWHLPLIVSGQYAAGRYPWLSAILFVPSVIAAGYVTARVRLASGSVWPAVVFHATWNAVIQGSFDRFTAGGDASKGTTVWTGEGGVLVVVVSIGLTLVLVGRPFPVRRYPADPEERALDIRTA